MSPSFRFDIYEAFLDEAHQRQLEYDSLVENARKELDDFYKMAAEDLTSKGLKIKPATFKKLVKSKFFAGETDKEIVRVLEKLESFNK